MAHYAKPGHEPTDDEIARHGLRAFSPARKPFAPTGDDFRRAHRDVATGDADELRDLAEELAGLFPGDVWPFYGYGGYGYTWTDD